MRAIVGLLLLTAVFASAPRDPRMAAIVQKVTKDLSSVFKTQDNSELTLLCQSGITTYFQQIINNPSVPLELKAELTTLIGGLAQCLNPMCGLVNSPCWTDFQTNLPSDNCVPGLAQAASSVLTDLCTNGCFTQLDSVVVTSAQCFANWAAQNGGAAAGNGIDFGSINLNQMSAASDLLCMQNPADDGFCVARLSASSTLLVDTVNIADSANCPYFASLGCCATGLELLLGVFNGTQSTCGSAVTPFTPSQYRQALVNCGLGNVAQCPVINALAKIGVINWVIDHIDFTVWNGLSAQAKLDFMYALRTDFANSTGIARDLVSVGIIIQAATGISVKFILRAVSDLLTQTNFANYQAYISGATPQFPALTQFAEGYSGLSTGAVQFNSAASSDSLSTQSGGGSSGATSAILSFGAIVLAVVVAIFA